MSREAIQLEATEALRARVRELADLLRVTAPAVGADGDVQAALGAIGDALLERASRIGSSLPRERGALDAGEALAARLVLADLALVAAAWRALGVAAAGGLAQAEAALAEARAVLDPVLAEADE